MSLCLRKKQDSFTVTDRRLFTSEGEARNEVSEEQVESKPVPQPQAAAAPVPEPSPEPAEAMPEPPTDAEQKQQADAYLKSAKELDARVELSGHSSKELEMTFERFMASLYMTAMLQTRLNARARWAASS